MDTAHSLHHEQHHEQEKTPSTLGRIIMLVSVIGGFWLIDTLQQSHHIPMPAWATTLIFAIIGILIGGSSVVVPEKGGAKAATYVGFVFVAIAILMMFNGWFFHSAGH